MRDATGQQYRRNRYYDPATGQFTQPDPIGLAGGVNAYGFAAGDPVSYSDPYGLCPPKDNEPCNMETGDLYLDTPEYRQLMEDAYKHKSQPDSVGFKREIALACNTVGVCRTNRLNGTTQFSIFPSVPGTVAFDAHTHGNEGKFTKDGDFFGWGPSPLDRSEFNRTQQQYPSYVIGQNFIWRLDRDEHGNTRTTRFERWKF